MEKITPLLDIIKKITQFGERDIADCSNAFEEIRVPKLSLLQKEQTIPRYLYFIVAGYMRMFYVDIDDRERTTLLCGPGEFITPFLPFIHEQKAQENLASITDCIGLKISRNDLAALISRSEPFKAFSLVIFEQALKEANQRANDLANMQGHQRYKKFVENKPDIALHVPGQYIASYLGLQPGSLSRIRRKGKLPG